MKHPITRKFIVPLLIAILLAAMGLQLLLAAKADGVTTDEQIHILSGYTTLTAAHILFDPEHPFLAKVIATLPLLVIHPKVPGAAQHLDAAVSDTNYNTYAEANLWGYQLLYMMGNNLDQLLWATRAMMALLTIGCAWVLWKWTKSLFGTASSLAALIFFVFDPSFLGHGHLVNDDTAATLFFVASLALFHAFLHKPTYVRMLAAGIILGLGLITKFSLLLLGPTYLLLLILWLLYQRRHQNPIQPAIFHRVSAIWLKYGLGLAGIFAIAWGVIWLGYGSLMLINPAQNPQIISPHPHIPTWVAFLTTHTLPVMWAKGAALLFSPQAHGRDGYLLGQCYTGGRWDYFAILSVFKITITTMALFGTSLLLWWRKRSSIGFTPIFLLTPMAIYFAFSSSSSINIGFRHLLPFYALLLVAASYPYSLVNWHQWMTQAQTYIQRPRKSRINRQLLLPALMLVALASAPLVSLLAYPNYLSYFNILAQEPRPIPYIASDSNIDWGQGTKQLQTYMKQQHINQLMFDNFIGVTEAQYRGMSVTQADPQDHGYKGYLALSRSTIVDHICTKNNDWGWVIDHHQPVAIIGDAINLYKIE